MIKHSLSFLLIFKTLFRSQGGRGDYIHIALKEQDNAELLVIRYFALI